MIEAAVVQWFWKEEVFPSADQFNRIHETLLAKWKDIAPFLTDGVVHFAHGPAPAREDRLTTASMIDLGRQAGLETHRLAMREIGWRARDDGLRGAFVGMENEPIRTCYELYPREWMAAEDFGPNLACDAGRTLWIEPIWKLIWSNKAILPILWDLSPRRPNLLWATAAAAASNAYVRKPRLSREGGNISIVRDGAALAATDGPHAGRPIYQDYFELPSFDGQRPVIGSWCVDGAPAGMGIGEDGLITGNLARFVPHIIV